MSAIMGTVVLGPYSPIPTEWAHMYNLNAEQVAAHNQRVAEHERAEQSRLDEAAKFPIEGVSGEFSSGCLRVWPTGTNYKQLYIEKERCSFCQSETYCINASDDYNETMVCQSCANQLFYVLAAREVSA